MDSQLTVSVRQYFDSGAKADTEASKIRRDTNFFALASSDDEWCPHWEIGDNRLLSR